MAKILQLRSGMKHVTLTLLLFAVNVHAADGVLPVPKALKMGVYKVARGSEAEGCVPADVRISPRDSSVIEVTATFFASLRQNARTKNRLSGCTETATSIMSKDTPQESIVTETVVDSCKSKTIVARVWTFRPDRIQLKDTSEPELPINCLWRR